MVKKLSVENNSIVMEFLLRSPATNLFILGDIYNNGYECAYQRCWGDFDARGSLRAVLLAYHHHYILAAYGEHDCAAFAAICREDEEFINIAGSSANVNYYLELLDTKSLRRFCFAQLDQLTDFGVSDIAVHKATVDDADALASMLQSIAEFPNKTTASRIATTIGNSEGRYVYITVDGDVAATAASTAENPHSAMIVAVACAPEYRKRGYATACVRYLCEELTREGKSLCLFFDNPAAGNIYRRLGFYDIGDWMLAAI